MSMIIRKALPLLSFLLLFSTHLVAQEKVTIEVKDSKGAALEYPEIIIGDKYHRVGTLNGDLDVEKSVLKVGDAIIVKFLGYKTHKLSIDQQILGKDKIHVVMEEDAYLLEPLIVHQSDFDADKYFQKRKKHLLLPYYKSYSIDIDFNLIEDGDKDHPIKGHITAESERFDTIVDSMNMVVSAPILYSSEVVYAIKRASELNYLAAYILCHGDARKNFYCDYRGKDGDLELWEFTLRQQKNMPWGTSPNDELRCFVSLDVNGYIANVRTQFTPSSEVSTSYLLETKYTLVNRKLVAEQTIMDVLPNAKNNKYKPIYLNLSYSNFRKK